MKVIKYFIVALVVIGLTGCEEKSTEPRIMQIKASGDKFEHLDTIYMKNISRSDSIMFWYDNDDFKGSMDTLLILKNETRLMGKTLEFISNKEFTTTNGNRHEIKKYYYDGDGFHGFNIFYINEEKGVVINITHNDMIIEYDYIKNEELIEKIKFDTIFFGYE